MEDLDGGVNVAIVGAGWAGLAAAVKLAEARIPVSVFEAARHLGGRARSVEVEGIALDNGQHILIGAYRETLALMRTVGADPEELLLRTPLAIEFPGQFRLQTPRLPAPWHLLTALLTATGLAPHEKLAAMRFMRTMRNCDYRIALDMTLGELLARHRQTGALARFLWEPLCVSALNTPAAAASAQVFLNVLRDALGGTRANSDLLIPRADLGKLFPEAAAAYVRAHGGSVQTGAPVRTLERLAHGFVLDADSARYSHVILAVAPHQLDSLLAPLPALAATRLRAAALTYEPIYTCYLQYPQEIRMPRPMTGFAGGTIQWIFDRGRLNGIPGLLAAVVSARGAHQNLSQDQVALAIQGGLATLLPGLPMVRWSRVIAEKRATFSCRPGVVRPGNQTAISNLYLAGDYTASDYPATLEAAVRSGVRAARLVQQSLNVAAKT